jgi:hypothetical protein
MSRKMWRTLEPIHGMIYFAPEAAAAYAAAGLDDARAGYFASRAAPMGAVPASVVVATFFNFHPVLVGRAVPRCWSLASPSVMLAARLEAADAALRRMLGAAVVTSPEVVEAASLARTAASAPAPEMSVVGRPLYAGHASLPWPEEPHLVLWHAISLLREYRGDGHIAQLVVHGLSGLESLVTHAAAGDVPPNILLATRAWSQEDWRQAADDLRQKGWLEQGDELRFTPAGTQRRQQIEDGTDALAVAPYATLGEERCAELRTLARPWSKAFAEHLR